MNFFLILFGGLLIDYFIGDPEKFWRRYPHPTVLMGKLVGFADRTLNKGGAKKIKGIIVIALLTLLAIIVGSVFWMLPRTGILGFICSILQMIVLGVLLAHKSLVSHVSEVGHALSETLPAGRHAVSAIVGRNTNEMTEEDVARAAIESGAENFSDGVIAPAFWFLILGIPGILAYKMINTADSMIGYETERHQEFGFGAAKLDDFVNWVPARLTGILMCAVHLSKDAFNIMQTDAEVHRSPNAGWPEGAMAGILNISLAGPRMYHGEMSYDLYLNKEGRKDLNAEDIAQSVKVLNRSWTAFAAFIGIVGVVLFAF